MKLNEDQDPGVPFPSSYWVVPGEFLAGYFPGAPEEEMARKKIIRLLGHGIRHIINLMEPHELNQEGVPFASYEEQVRLASEALGLNVTIDRMPIKDGGVPSRPDMANILDAIDRSMERSMPVYVHCLGGRGRTGTVVGCFLARHGFSSGYGVVRLIQEIRRHTVDSYMPSPETPEQLSMVLSWGLRE